jgi:hypothetical protein
MSMLEITLGNDLSSQLLYVSSTSHFRALSHPASPIILVHRVSGPAKASKTFTIRIFRTHHYHLDCDQDDDN